MKITVGIPTFLASKSMYSTLKSIYEQKDFTAIDEVLVVIDGNHKIDISGLRKAFDRKLRIIIKKVRAGQAARINDIFDEAKNELLILTNDDVIWDKNVVSKFIESYGASRADLITARVTPVSPENLVEYASGQSAYIAERISHRWNNFKNYLSCNGRLLLLHKNLYKNMKIPSGIWNNDAYIYLYALENKYTHSHQPRSVVYYKAPSTIAEHLKQSSKFQFSIIENQKYFKRSISKYFVIPKYFVIRSFIDLLLKNIFAAFLYFVLLIISRLNKTLELPKNSYWETDLSTKKI